jgi:hypothetical protein
VESDGLTGKDVEEDVEVEPGEEAETEEAEEELEEEEGLAKDDKDE